MSVTLPAHPEIELTAVAKTMTIRILECNRGGFILVFDQGMAACSSFTEALEAIENEGVRAQQWDRPDHIPSGIHPDRPDPVDRVRTGLKDAVHSVTAALAAMGAAAAMILSAKIA